MTYQYLRVTEPAAQREINKFYRRHKLNVSVNRLDQVHCCYYKDEIVGVGFIRTLKYCNQPLSILRSVYVAPAHREKGIARDICSFLLSTKSDTYTLCDSHLVTFYRSLGMEESGNKELPEVMLKQIKKGLTLLVKPS